jgi:hypothetical protein
MPETPTETSSRPSASDSQLKTPGDYASLSYCRQLEKCIEEHGIEDSPTRKLSEKVSNGVLRQGAEFAILQKENTGLKKEVTNRPIDVDSFEFMQLRSKFSDNVRTFKNKTIDRFVIHIDELISESEKGGKWAKKKKIK